MHVLIAHPGTQHSGALATQVKHVADSTVLLTGLVVPGSGVVAATYSALPKWAQQRLERRVVGGLAGRDTRSFPLLELASLLAIRMGFEGPAVVKWRNEVFQRAVPKAELCRSDIVIGFDTASDVLVDRCNNLGKPLVLDQTTGHTLARRAILSKAACIYPAWAATQPEILAEPHQREAELVRSNHIVVASNFAKSTLTTHGIPEAKITVIPYGVALPKSESEQPRKSRQRAICFVGNVTLQKGAPKLLAAWERTAPKDYKLIIAGYANDAAIALLKQYDKVDYRGHVRRSELPSLFAECDALVFPSHFDGFGMVMLEAMAHGLPIIASSNSAGPDLITTGENGWVYLDDEADSLELSLTHFFSVTSLLPLSQGARARARHLSLSQYGHEWGRVLSEVGGGTPI
jgi:starch synthase